MTPREQKRLATQRLVVDKVNMAKQLSTDHVVLHVFSNQEMVDALEFVNTSGTDLRVETTERCLYLSWGDRPCLEVTHEDKEAAVSRKVAQCVHFEVEDEPTAGRGTKRAKGNEEAVLEPTENARFVIPPEHRVDVLVALTRILPVYREAKLNKSDADAYHGLEVERKTTGCDTDDEHMAKAHRGVTTLVNALELSEFERDVFDFELGGIFDYELGNI